MSGGRPMTAGEHIREGLRLLGLGMQRSVRAHVAKVNKALADPDVQRAIRMDNDRRWVAQLVEREKRAALADFDQHVEGIYDDLGLTRSS